MGDYRHTSYSHTHHDRHRFPHSEREIEGEGGRREREGRGGERGEGGRGGGGGEGGRGEEREGESTQCICLAVCLTKMCAGET